MKSNSILITVISGLALVIFAWILGDAYKYKYRISNTINVTGNAKMDFESDLVKWNAYFSRKSMDLSAASVQLRRDRELVREFLIAQGIAAEEILFDAVNINREFSYDYDNNGRSYQTFTGYSLTQNVSVESRDLDKVDNASREISTLLSQGIELSSFSPSYYYSKLEDLKLELISQASDNARQRAKNIATQAGTSLGKLVKADLGIFQITGQNDNEEYSYGGVFNTTSRNKTANITVRASFSK
ncbi:MAG TPA: SIMPL domain-containing protein [Sphingobacteriaceae bacterium]|nr:SIMPL domain-containing protein [Sphingobacteriaceae bacterium]